LDSTQWSQVGKALQQTLSPFLGKMMFGSPLLHQSLVCHGILDRRLPDARFLPLSLVLLLLALMLQSAEGIQQQTGLHGAPLARAVGIGGQQARRADARHR
jgi:hypothetical protein